MLYNAYIIGRGHDDWPMTNHPKTKEDCMKMIEQLELSRRFSVKVMSLIDLPPLELTEDGPYIRVNNFDLYWKLVEAK